MTIKEYKLVGLKYRHSDTIDHRPTCTEIEKDYLFEEK